MNTLFIYNSDAGDKSFGEELDFVIGRLQDKGMTLTIHKWNSIGALDDIPALKNPGAYEKIVIAGGDGTVNGVASLILKHGVDVPVGIIPVGRTNDFAKHFDLPSQIDELVDTIAGDDYAYSDVARANGEVFLNAVLIGIKEFQNLNPFKVKIKSRGFDFEGGAFLISIMNSGSLGGFKSVLREADIDDGMLDILVIKKCPIFELGQVLISLGSGTFKESKHVMQFRTDSLEIISEDEISTRIDGEEGPSCPLKISVDDEKLKVLSVPLGGAERGNTVFSFSEVMRATGGIIEIIKDMPRHNVVEYINKDTLGEGYYKTAASSLDDGYIYLVLSSTGTAAGEMIRSVTKKDYSHISLSFDAELKTLLSYNGGNNLFSPGMNHELLKFFYKKKDANLLIYKIKATREQKQAALDEVGKIDREGSSYNLIGLLLPYSHKENIMFCSQFIYHILKKTGLAYFKKEAHDVKPMDFVEMDFRRNLEFHSQIYLRDVITK